MSRFTQLLAAAALLAISTQTTFAQCGNEYRAMHHKGTKKAEARLASNTKDAAVLLMDNNPQYKIWRNEYKLDKVEYRTDATVMHFRYVGNNYSWVTLYAPDGDHAWMLRDEATKKEFKLKGVYNVVQNGKPMADQIATDRLDIYSDGESDKLIVTCEVHFEALPAKVKVVDMIEGKGTDSRSNYFHVLNIQMKTPKVAKEKPAGEEPSQEIIIEEVMAKVEKPKAETTFSIVEGVECRVYPNPTVEVINVEFPSAQEAKMNLMSSNGQLVWSGIMQDSNSTIDVREYPAGNYFLHITVGDKTAVKSIVIE